MDFKNFFILLLTSCFLFSISAQSANKNVILSDAKNVPELKYRQGYLLAYINAEGVAPSLEFSKVSTRKTGYMSPDEKINEKIRYTKTYFLDLKGVSKGLYFIPMVAGIYQITRINAPFYNLPYWLPTQKETKWRFVIEENYINFIGEFKIKKERGAHEIDVNLLNRIATYYDQIHEEIAILPIKYPLKNNPGYRDDFIFRQEY